MIFNTIVSTAALAEHLRDAQWIIFDCRFSLADPKAGIEAYQINHIPNARYAHLDDDLSSAITPVSGRHPLPDFALLAEKLGGWGVDNNSQVVVYDDASGSFASRLWWLLRCLGHDEVAVLDGGITQWQKEQRELSTAKTVITPTIFQPRRRHAQWLDAAQLQHRLQNNDSLLLDARAPERYRGDHEPVDAVAGHVPGALNHPWKSNLDNDGLFLTSEQLLTQFTALFGDTPSARIVHMCGSGVTACHNLLAMEIAGLSGSFLYPGSWSEWIRDPQRPVAIGND
ncbi:MAG: sulfurtransferase [Gammaproteobacteria bacterium]